MKTFKVGSICSGYGSLYIGRRYARRRQPPQGATVESTSRDAPLLRQGPTFREDAHALPDVSSLQSHSMAAAPATTSLDNIRSQLSMMRAENVHNVMTKRLAAPKRRHQDPATSDPREQDALRGAPRFKSGEERDDYVTAVIQREYAKQNKPSEAFRVGQEVVDGVQWRAFLLDERRLRDTDEVVRKVGDDRGNRTFAQLAFPSSSWHAAQVLEVVHRMEQHWAKEYEDLQRSRDGTHDVVNALGNDEGGDTQAMKRLAWLTVLEQMPKEEICSLWNAGVLDTETLSSLLEDPLRNTAPAAEESLNETSEEAPNNEELPLSADNLLDMKIKYLQQLRFLQEITSTIRETELGDVPSIDLAPILVKVQRRHFDDVSQSELRQLENYEEAAVMKLSLRASPNAVMSEPKSVDVPRALLDRVLFPSNSFLSAVAQRDAALRRSLEGLERIKRETLLDPDFQDAVRFAHTAEEASVAPHVRGWSADAEVASDASHYDKGSTAHVDGARRTMLKREKRLQRSHELRGPMARSPFSPEAVPYFYSDVRSIVPPRGSFNLPHPTPSKAERAALRGQRRRLRKGVRYTK